MVALSYHLNTKDIEFVSCGCVKTQCLLVRTFSCCFTGLRKHRLVLGRAFISTLKKD